MEEPDRRMWGIRLHAYSRPLSLSLQFTVVGVFGKIPEATVAVDAISIAPCGGKSMGLGRPPRIGGGSDGEPDLSFSHLPLGPTRELSSV
jgi:hypothetical protein